MDKLKGSLFSKTMWFGFAVTALGVGNWIADHAGLITVIAPAAAPYLAVVGPVVMILRAVTGTPLEEKA